ncbi:MAG: hypothetical protein JWQ74_379 [Marmoricola sp.]|nr:hypothetical protein [Marmoricola sp.]
MAFNMFSVIRYEGPDERSLFAWRHPDQELRPGTTLIVNPGQQAVFLSNGRVVETYGPGKHRIEGNNPQLLQAVKKQFTGGISPDTSTLWFVTSIEVPPVKWGTPARQTVRVLTGREGRAVTAQVGARGNFTAQVADLGAVITKYMPSQADQITLEVLQARFRDEAMSVITDAIAEAFIELNIPFDEINARKTRIADFLLPLVGQSFARLGIEIVTFRIDDINLDDATQAKIVARQNQREDRYEDGMAQNDGTIGATGAQRMLADADLYTRKRQADAAMADADARAHAQQVEEYSYQEKRKFDVLEAAAQKEGTGGALMDAGMGLTMGLGLGNAMGGLLKEAVVAPVPTPVPTPTPEPAAPAATGTKFCTDCGESLPATAKFCFSCGHGQ